MSIAVGSYIARVNQPGRSAGQICSASTGLTSRSSSAVLCPSARSVAKRASCSGAAISRTPRGPSSGCSAKPGGGASRKGRVPTLNARIGGLP